MLEKVTERIYYLMNDDGEERPAIGLVKGNNACLVIDGGNSKAHADMFLNYVKEMDLPPIKYVVATHHHWDHIFGMARFDAIKIASKTTTKLASIYWNLKLDDSSLEEAKSNKILDDLSIKMIKEEYADKDFINEISFDMLFTGEMEINLGGVTCMIKEMINPHRDDGTIVYIPEEKTLFLGDAAYGCTKNARSYFDRERLISMMEEVESYNADYCLCSHESICTKEEMSWYFNKLKMGLETTQGFEKIEDIILRYKEIYNNEPKKEDFFFLESIYE